MLISQGRGKTHRLGEAMSDVLTHEINVRVTLADKQFIQETARAEQISMSELMRASALEKAEKLSMN